MENKEDKIRNNAIEAIAEMAKPLALFAIFARGTGCDMAFIREHFHEMIDKLFADVPKEDCNEQQ